MESKPWAHLCLCPFTDLIQVRASFNLILLIPLCQHPLMKCLSSYSIFSASSFLFPSSIVFGLLSVILQGKVMKGQHTEGALLCFVLLLSRPLLFVFYFCLWQQTLSVRWPWDKPFVVLCVEIIRQADKAFWVSSSLLLLSSPTAFSSFHGVLGSSQRSRVIKPVRFHLWKNVNPPSLTHAIPCKCSFTQ